MFHRKQNYILGISIFYSYIDSQKNFDSVLSKKKKGEKQKTQSKLKKPQKTKNR